MENLFLDDTHAPAVGWMLPNELPLADPQIKLFSVWRMDFGRRSIEAETVEYEYNRNMYGATVILTTSAQRAMNISLCEAFHEEKVIQFQSQLEKLSISLCIQLNSQCSIASPFVHEAYVKLLWLWSTEKQKQKWSEAFCCHSCRFQFAIHSRVIWTKKGNERVKRN